VQEKKQVNTGQNILINIIQQALDDSKAQAITVLSVKHLTSITDSMFICTGSSGRQMKFVAESVVKAVRGAGFKVLGTEGFSNSDWMIVDCGDAVVHVMSADARAFSHLEGLWDISESNQDVL